MKFSHYPRDGVGFMIDYDNAELPPILVKQYEEISVKQAVARVGLSDKHIRRLFAKYRLGAKVGRNSPLRISEPALVMVRHGDFGALELLRAGERDNPLVARYFLELGYLLVPSKARYAPAPSESADWRRKVDLSP